MERGELDREGSEAALVRGRPVRAGVRLERVAAALRVLRIEDDRPAALAGALEEGLEAAPCLLIDPAEPVDPVGALAFIALKQLSGASEIRMANEERILCAGDMTILTTDTPYSIEFEGGMPCFILRFPPQMLGLPPDSSRASGRAGVPTI